MSVAKSYAKAFFEAAKEHRSTSEQISQFENELNSICQLLNQYRELRVALQGPITTTKEKMALVDGLGDQLKVSPLVKQFLILLARKDRMGLLREIQEALNSIRLMAEGGIPAQLITAEPISESDIQSLAKAFGQKLGKKVSFQVSTDPSLLAGIKVTVNGVSYDGTLRSQLLKLRDRFVTGTSSNYA